MADHHLPAVADFTVLAWGMRLVLGAQVQVHVVGKRLDGQALTVQEHLHTRTHTGNMRAANGSDEATFMILSPRELRACVSHVQMLP